jgi:nitrogen fixation protein FixH
MTVTQTCKHLSGRSVLAILIAFFGVVFAVNGYFAFAAINTYSGVVAQEPYRKGLTYNRRIQAGERQVDLGWTAELNANRDGDTRLVLADSDGRPVSGLTVRAILGRPSTGKFDRALAFVEIAPGNYLSTEVPLDDGNWIVTLTAHEANATEPILQLRRRLWLKP